MSIQRYTLSYPAAGMEVKLGEFVLFDDHLIDRNEHARRVATYAVQLLSLGPYSTKQAVEKALRELGGEGR